jgi:REP element-mobilizing transposase RayT
MPLTQGHRALRKGRHSQAGGIYLVTFITAQRRQVFLQPELAIAACRTFRSSITAEHASLLCWVLMPDHFHGLVQLGDEASLSRCVQRLKSRSAKACHHAQTGSIPVWDRAFHDHAVRREEDVRALARYVIANPLRAGLVDNVLSYPYWDAVWL